jgi:ATP-dependent helicase HrpB
VAERRQKLGAIVLHRQPLADPPPELVVAALGEGLRRQGLDLLPWGDRAVELRARLSWLHGEAPQEWPAVDDAALLDQLDGWLDLSRCRQPADLQRLDLTTGLLSLLDWRQRAALDEQAPPRLAIPGGRDRALDYRSGRPVLSVRLQHLIGLDRHPVIGPNRVPVTIELLSPAGRPAQVTTDLPGFWRGSYAAVRSDLRGRYPKHRWPERPWEADHDG